MKKVLSIVLCVAMILGSFSMVFGATTLTDRADINETFNEAVDVMTTTGIIEGYEDGSFKPTEPVTRAQMAKMISVLMNGGDDVSALYANANKFTDMENANWAKGFVAYCVGKGIIAGRSATVFDPSANVTATEAAKMLLVALGYDADIEGYVGATWKVNVQSDAKDNDLYDDLSISDYDAPLTRESAAQLIFNAMNADTVDYFNKSTVTVGDVVINQNTKADAETFTGNTGDKYGDAFVAGDTIPLWAKAFKGDLKYYAAKADDFGRPAHQWKWDDGDEVNSIGKYSDSEDYAYTATKGYATLAKFIEDVDEDLYDDIKAGDKEVVSIQMNGADYGTEDVPGAILPGDMVEVFDDDDELTFVIMRYEFAEITDVDTDVSSSDAKDDVTCYVALTDTLDINEVDKIKDTDFTGFVADTYVEDAYVAVAVSAADANTIIDSYILESAATAKITRVAANDAVTNAPKNFVAGGETYTLAGGYKAIDNNNTDDEFNFYVDKNGYLLAIEVEEDNSSKNFGIVTGVRDNTDDWGGDKAYQVKILTADGKETIYDVDTDKNDDVFGNLATYTTLGNKTAITYAADSDNVTGINVKAADSVLVKFTLNKDGEVKAITKDDVNSALIADEVEKTVSKTGTVGGAKLSKDVVAFWYDEDDSEWKAYTYKDLLEKDIKGLAMSAGDGDQVVLLLKNDVDAEDDIVGVVNGTTKFSDSDGDKYEVELFVDGKSVTYNTVEDTANDANDPYSIANGLDVADIVVLKINKDNEITSLKKADLAQSNEPVSTFAEGKDGVRYAANGVLIPVTDASSSNIKVTVEAVESDYFSLADAYVYRIKVADGEYDEIVSYSASSVKKGGYVFLAQTDEDSEIWDTVLYMTASDYESLAL